MTRPETEPPNGTPENGFPIEETNPGIRSAVHELSGAIGMPPADDERRSHAQELASELMKLAGGGGGNVPPGDVAKKLKRHNWIFAVVIALFGSGGVVASYYATEARSKDNATEIENHAAQPMHEQATKRVDTIERGLTKVQTDIGQIKTEQMSIGAGIEQLKQEAQTDKQKRTERELEDLKRENIRLRRRGQ